MGRIATVTMVVIGLIFLAMRGNGQRGAPEEEQKTVAATKSKTLEGPAPKAKSEGGEG